MALTTRSQFYYGIIVDSSNFNLDIRIGMTNYQVPLTLGRFSLTDFANSVQIALRQFTPQDFVVTVNRDTRVFTISAPVAFQMLFLTGLNTLTNASELLGFQEIDYTGASTYTGVFGVGKSYRPQFILQDYVPTFLNVEANASRVNESASGINESVTFGRRETMSCNITYVTNLEVSCAVNSIEYDAQGLENLLDFLDYCILKGNIEFMPDRDDANNFEKLNLEKTGSSSNGTGYRIRELTGRRLPGFYETGLLDFRKIIF